MSTAITPSVQRTSEGKPLTPHSSYEIEILKLKFALAEEKLSHATLRTTIAEEKLHNAVKKLGVAQGIMAPLQKKRDAPCVNKNRSLVAILAGGFLKGLGGGLGSVSDDEGSDGQEGTETIIMTKAIAGITIAKYLDRHLIAQQARFTESKGSFEARRARARCHLTSGPRITV